jgi:hypothetical protein
LFHESVFSPILVISDYTHTHTHTYLYTVKPLAVDEPGRRLLTSAAMLKPHNPGVFSVSLPPFCPNARPVLEQDYAPITGKLVQDTALSTPHGR